MDVRNFTGEHFSLNLHLLTIQPLLDLLLLLDSLLLLLLRSKHRIQWNLLNLRNILFHLRCIGVLTGLRLLLHMGVFAWILLLLDFSFFDDFHLRLSLCFTFLSLYLSTSHSFLTMALTIFSTSRSSSWFFTSFHFLSF